MYTLLCSPGADSGFSKGGRRVYYLAERIEDKNFLTLFWLKSRKIMKKVQVKGERTPSTPPP